MSLIKQVRFGSTGIRISPIIVGCMSYGSRKCFPWCLEDEEKIFEILKYCYDHGMRTFDTADVYSNGTSERILGEFLKKYQINRETVVILSKVHFPVDESIEGLHDLQPDPTTERGVSLSNQMGLSRKHILTGAKNSVERLGTYMDVLQIHRLDPNVSYKEIMKSLNDVVEAGYTRYIGASTMLATEFAELQFLADKHDWFQFVNLQTQYNLLYREDERELIPFAKKHGIAMTPWSPNARGALTRPVGSSTERTGFDQRINALSDTDKEIVSRVEQVAKEKNVAMATVATAWVLSKGFCPIVGMSSIERVDDVIKAINLELTEENIQFLEEPYQPKFYNFQLRK